MSDYGFKNWTREDLVEYLEFLIHNYRVMDAFWFINLENELGHDEACRYNEQVWGRVAQLAARDLKERFDFSGGGLEAFVRAQKMFPWSILVDYQYEVRDGEVIIRVAKCPTQEARLQRGLGEYDCQAMHKAEFSTFAHEIDPRIQVQCVFAPPDEHPADQCCEWRFTLAED